ncbi:MAG: DJ-1/PfpI family protein [Hydrogenophaga sp.]|uniref:DJ-1/PfpI family protein n=1 Tax=Hydrogenophaga sp. TaxID=1904254 RepID=UPI0026169F48|nr:DJ-1/PfpI family protein [Hydrogenophaga sp.]MCV0437173.1 DJ-1/PfpI family protein [Hydrogenophaga sp.]
MHPPPPDTSTASFSVAILAFDEVEALDFAGPYEVFTTASRVHARQQTAGAPALFEVRSVARSLSPVRARAGLRLLPDTDFTGIGQPDVLVVPGGVIDQPLRCAATLAWLRQAHPRSRITASVCTGVFALAAAGVVSRERVTTHWEDITDLRTQFPALQVEEHVRWIDNGHTVSSAGISAGIDMSLHLVARLAGDALARRTARQMDYRWQTA